MFVLLPIIFWISINNALALPQRGNIENVRLQQHRGYKSTAQSFKPTTIPYSNINSEDNDEAPSQSILARTPSYGDDIFPIRNSIAVIQPRPQPKTQQPQQFRRPSLLPQQFKQQLEEESKKQKEEEEEEEPDRLSILLPQSKFDCVGKSTGYYADDGLGCEVFHYCQDNAKHSWICPEGFTFHQVHLICMPPGNDNICEQSSKYHFVNNYLYKPLNLEEHQTKPNVSLRYSERYFPEQYHYEQSYEEEDDEPKQYRQPVRAPVQHHSQVPAPRIIPVQRRPAPVPFSPTFRPETTIGQVFRSPEEVNISLQQRRPPFIAQRYINTDEREY